MFRIFLISMLLFVSVSVTFTKRIAHAETLSELNAALAAKPDMTQDLYLLGKAYEQGAGVPKDEMKAAELYRQAWKNGSKEAYDRLIEIYGAAVMEAQQTPEDRAKRAEKRDSVPEPTPLPPPARSPSPSLADKFSPDYLPALENRALYDTPQPADSKGGSKALSVPGTHHALVIGINGYKKIKKLENAVNDAKEISTLLADQYGFQTRIILEDQATRDNIMIALNDYRKQLHENDSLLIYFSGHGEFNKDTDTSYWLPVDADHNDTTKWLESRAISDQLKLMASRQVLIVADSCFSGTMTRNADTSLTDGRLRNNYLEKLLTKPARVLIASGGNEPVTDGGAKNHSIFADAFIKALQNPFDTRFTAEELLARHLKESVAGRTDQTPEYRVIRNSGHDGGDFVFEKRK